MKSYKLSLQAQQTLEDIIGWTIDQFGINQAVAYKNQLLNRLSSLAAGEPPHGRSCNLLVSGVIEVTDLEYCREGQLFIIFRNTKKIIFVADFVHGSRNLEKIIQELTKSKAQSPTG